jgi:hypothetical protein
MAVRQWQPPPGYYWKVVVDPTRSGEEPGMFYGGHFRWSDIVLPSGCHREARRIPCPWPHGTVFENVKTGERVVIKRGKVVRESKKGGQTHGRYADSGQDRARK